MDFEFDGVLEALAGERREYVLANEEIKQKKYYPLYRNYPNGSSQYYARLSGGENFEQEEFPEVGFGFLDNFKKDAKKVKRECIKEFKKVKSECVKEFKSIFKSFTENPYF